MIGRSTRWSVMFLAFQYFSFFSRTTILSCS